MTFVQVVVVFTVEVDEEPMRQLDGEEHANKIFTLFGGYVDDEAARAEEANVDPTVCESAMFTCTSHRGLWLEFVDVDPVTCE